MNSRAVSYLLGGILTGCILVMLVMAVVGP
jgi:hypothetical protein